jgi:AcrR family transcriptional regulator
MAQPATPTPPSAWRPRAVDRSGGPSREQAPDRSSQFLAAAGQLLDETGRIDFTVQDIVDRSGLSLRAFYKHFGGKGDLLLALFEELLSGYVAELRAEVEVEDDAFDQLRAYVVGSFTRTQQAPARGSQALGIYHLSMLETRRDDFTRALAPQIDLLREIVDRGVQQGRFRTDLSPGAITHLLTATMVLVSQMRVLDVDLAGAALDPDELWAWCEQAVRTP